MSNELFSTVCQHCGGQKIHYRLYGYRCPRCYYAPDELPETKLELTEQEHPADEMQTWLESLTHKPAILEIDYIDSGGIIYINGAMLNKSEVTDCRNCGTLLMEAHCLKASGIPYCSVKCQTEFENQLPEDG